MTYFGNLNCIPGLKANADLSSYQFRFVKFTSGKVTYCSTTGEQAIGVLQDKPAAADRAAAVAGYNGTTTKVEAGAAISAGADVMTDTEGRAITHTSAAGLQKLGVAVTAATAAGEMIDCILITPGVDINGSSNVRELDITTAREIASNDTQNLAAHGGILCADSTPILERANDATDKCLRLNWAASDSNEIAFAPVMKPHDLDAGTDFTIHFMAKMGGATDEPAVDFQCWDGEGDTEMGGSATVTGTTLTEYTVTIANANVAAAPGFINVQVVPAAHTTDALYIYGAWIEFPRKVN